MRCNQFGCECCTCLECRHYLEYCICDFIKQAEKFIKENEWSKDPKIIKAVEIMGELIS